MAEDLRIRVPSAVLGIVVSLGALIGSFVISLNVEDATTELRLDALERRVASLEEDQRSRELALQDRLTRLSDSLSNLQGQLATLTRGGAHDR